MAKNLRTSRFKYFILLFCLIQSIFLCAQNTIWNEDFNSYTDGTTTSSKWTLTVTPDVNGSDPNDYFKVLNNEMRIRETNGNEQIFETETINISSYSNVSLSVDLRKVGGTMEAIDDYVNVYYVLDGGSEIAFTNNGFNDDDFPDLTATQTGLNGSTVKIVIRVQNGTGNAEIYGFDNILIEGIVNSGITYSNVSVSVNWPEWSSENRVEVYSPSGTLLTTIDNGYNGSSNNSYSTTVNLGCLEDLNNYSIVMYDTYGDGWNGTGANVTVTVGGVTVLSNDGSSTTTPNVGVSVNFDVSGGGAAEIQIVGNGNEIVNGDTTPTTLDDTDFGDVSYISGTIVKSFTINNLGCSPLTLSGASPYVTISGSSDFTVTTAPSATINSASSTTFIITFDPSTVGAINATVSIANNDTTGGEDPYTFSIRGTGTGTIPPPQYTAYYNNFDTSNDGWNVVTSTNDTWIRTNTFNNSTEMGEGYFWRNSSYNNYNNNTNIVIESPIYDFTGLKNLLFSIDIKYNTEDEYDGLRVLYSVNGGAYTLLGSSGTGTNWYEDYVDVFGTDGWNNDGHSADPTFNPHSQFGKSSIVLSDAIFSNVNNVRFRIEFRSDNFVTADGVAFDNVLIEADPITQLSDATIAPANITNNLRLWLKTNEGIAVTDGDNLTLWEDQAYATSLDKEDAYTANYLAPIYRDNGTRNINFNPVADFDHNNTEYMQGKGGFFAQDYFVVFRSDDEVATQTGSFNPGREFAIGGRFSDNSFHEDPTGLGMGSTSARFSDEILSHNVSSFPLSEPPNDTSYGRAYATNTETYNNHPLIVNVKSNDTRTSTEIYKNGKRVDNVTGIAGNGEDLNFNEFNNLQYLIGMGRSGITGRTTSQLNGMLTEVISYTSPNSAINQQKIQSYLGIKYGVTLQDDASALADYRLNDVDYIDSQGTVIWDSSANSGYNYDIAGIGRDDVSLLHQKQSRSQNDESDSVGPTSGILTIGLGDIYNTNKNNPNTFKDREFLVWGNNGADLNLAATTISVNMSEGISPALNTDVFFTGMQRIWKVVENGGDIPLVKVSIPKNAVRNISPPGSYLMFISDNDIFDPTADYRVMNEIGGNLYAEYDFDGTKYITFGYAPEIIVERSIYFDGISDYVDMEDALDLNTSEFTISAWIKRDTGTVNASIVSKRNATYTEGYDFRINASQRLEFVLNGGAASLASSVEIPENEWHQVAVIYNSGTATLYIDGVEDTSVSGLPAPIATTQSFNIAAAGKNTLTNFFAGNIDEVRVWDIALSPDQLRYIMNQEIVDKSITTGLTPLPLIKGYILPTTITKNELNPISWSNLAAYYPLSVYTYTNTNDMSGNGIQGALRNLNTVDRQTAPLPYISLNDGNWDATTTWQNGNVQTIPGSTSIVDNTKTVDWNIVHIQSNVTMDNTTLPAGNLGNRSVLGLMVDNSFELTATGTTTLATNANSAGTGNGLTVSHYLELDGKLDLEGESQLIQTTDSDLVVGTNGELERDQQGNGNVYRYNDWTSPVYSTIDGSNKMFTIAEVLKDGSIHESINSTYPRDISFIGGYNGSSGSPISIAEYWLYVRNANPFTSIDAAWDHVSSTDNIQVGAGFLMKGTGKATDQNYVFQGKPNNGDITVTVKNDNDYLVGNPYPSAIDADKFIADNAGAIEGTIYFWDHFGGDSHNLSEYQAGHATYTYMGGVAAASNLAHHTSNPSASGNKEPGKYIAVGQAFYVDGVGLGDKAIIFKNSQRVFAEEDGASSVFMKPGNVKTALKRSNKIAAKQDTRTKFRIGFTAPNGGYRQLLLGFDDNATNGVDYGFDGLMKGINNNDMFWALEGGKYVIQATDTFSLDSEFPLGIILKEAGTISIKVDELQNVDENTKLYIKDSFLDEVYDISLNPFEIELEAGEYIDRFTLVFQPRLKTLAEMSVSEGIFVRMNNAEALLEIHKIVDAKLKSIQLYNYLGQLITTWNKVPDDRTIYLPTNQFITGVYIVNIKTNGGVLTKKIIIE